MTKYSVVLKVGGLHPVLEKRHVLIAIVQADI